MSATLEGVAATEKQRRSRGVEKRDKFTAFRMTPSEFEAISARAQKADLSMTEYVVRAALGELDVEPADIDQRIAKLEERMARLEQLEFGE